MPSQMPRSRRDTCALVVSLACVLAVAGCSTASSPGLAPPPRTTVPERPASTAVTNAADSVGSIPGSPGAMFVFKVPQSLYENEGRWGCFCRVPPYTRRHLCDKRVR